jgi:hypothetical protein
MVMPTCFSKDCAKPRFLGYYVCAEHFVYYAAPQYTESMVLKAEHITCPAMTVFACEATSSSGQSEHAVPKSAGQSASEAGIG